jgi:hypothetical protein
MFGEYEATKSVVSAVNREGIWDLALKLTLQTLSPFGRGMVTPFNFHDLYLTILFKLGIVGASIFFGFFLYMTKSILFAMKKAVDIRRKVLLRACFISFTVLLINEVKFDFNRGSSYQQIIWAVFAVYLIAAEFSGFKSQAETTKNDYYKGCKPPHVQVSPYR